MPDDSLIARQLFTLSRRSPHKIRKTLSSSSSYVEITRRRNALSEDIPSCIRELSRAAAEREGESYSCLSGRRLSLSISQRRDGGPRGPGG